MEKYIYFWSGIYSQWHPCEFEEDGIVFNSAEQYMMYHKALLFNDKITADKILNASHPKDQKRLGRQVQNFKDDIWIQHCKKIVYNGNLLKFTQNPKLLTNLLKTEGEFVEASPYDNRWGIGLNEEDAKKLDKSQWQGTNWLGEILTQLREDLKNERGRS
jgi:ribA/ribD-fused uncharacterized protein